MPLHNVRGRNVIWWGDQNKDTHWPQLSHFIIQKYKLRNGKVKDRLTKDIFLDGYQFFINKFQQLINDETSVAFYAYVFGLHESSIEIYVEQLSGNTIEPFDEADFAVYRRVLKLILEQSCDLNLVVGHDLRVEVMQNLVANQAKLEDLLFLGEWIYGFAEHIAYLDLIGNCYGVSIDSDQIMAVVTYAPFTFLINEIIIDYQKHLHKVIVDSNGIIELKAALLTSLHVDYDAASSFLTVQRVNPQAKFGLIPFNLLKTNIATTHGYLLTDVNSFIDGLTISGANKLSISESVLRPQESNRYLYRPILKWNTNIGEVAIIGFEKWLESVVQIATNAVPWGYSPVEWKSNLTFKKYVQNKELSHDALLEDEVEKVLIKFGVPFIRNVKSLIQTNGNNVRCDIAGVGQIDMIAIDEERKVIFVFECKYNRSRFDMISWKKEHLNFRNEYNAKILNKGNWVKNNKLILSQHFKISLSVDIDTANFDVIPSYIINAPNFYLYDGIYPCYTLYSLERLLDKGITGKDYEITYKRKFFKRTFKIHRPYFTNAFESKIEMDKGILNYIKYLILRQLDRLLGYINGL